MIAAQYPDLISPLIHLRTEEPSRPELDELSKATLQKIFACHFLGPSPEHRDSLRVTSCSIGSDPDYGFYGDQCDLACFNL